MREFYTGGVVIVTRHLHQFVALYENQKEQILSRFCSRHDHVSFMLLTNPTQLFLLL